MSNTLSALQAEPAQRVCISSLATRPVLYTDTVGGKQTCRDDLWAVTTAELNELPHHAQPLPISSAPHDGTEVLAWSITGKTWHQVYWKTQENGDWLFLPPFHPRWACRWNKDYYQGQAEFSHWLPIPPAPEQTSAACTRRT